MYILVIISFLVNFLLLSLFGCFFGRNGIFLLTLSLVCLCFISSLFIFFEVALNNSNYLIDIIDWLNIEFLNIKWSFYFDTLTSVMLCVITFISLLVHLYYFDYMKYDIYIFCFIFYLSLFTFFMIILVISSNFLQFFLGWNGLFIILVLILVINFWFCKQGFFRLVINLILTVICYCALSDKLIFLSNLIPPRRFYATTVSLTKKDMFKQPENLPLKVIVVEHDTFVSESTDPLVISKHINDLNNYDTSNTKKGHGLILEDTQHLKQYVNELEFMVGGICTTQTEVNGVSTHKIADQPILIPNTLTQKTQNVFINKRYLISGELLVDQKLTLKEFNRVQRLQYGLEKPPVKKKVFTLLSDSESTIIITKQDSERDLECIRLKQANLLCRFEFDINIDNNNIHNNNNNHIKDE